MAELTNDRLDFALELILREMEMYAASFQGIRNTVQTTVTIGATVDAVLITGIFAKSSNLPLTPLALALGSIAFLLALSLVILWIAPSTLSWPNGYKVAIEITGSASDAKRSLIHDMNIELGRVRTRLTWYQRGIFPLMILLLLSVGSCVWLLRTQEIHPSPPRSTTTTTTVTTVTSDHTPSPSD